MPPIPNSVGNHNYFVISITEVIIANAESHGKTCVSGFPASCLFERVTIAEISL